MAGIYTSYGREQLAGIGLNSVAASVNHELILYSNTYAPVVGTQLSDLTEVVAAGYARKTLTSGSWTVATVAGDTTISYAAQTFTLTAASDIGGYAIVDDTDKVIAAEQNVTANLRIDPDGDVVITPVITVG